MLYYPTWAQDLQAAMELRQRDPEMSLEDELAELLEHELHAELSAEFEAELRACIQDF